MFNILKKKKPIFPYIEAPIVAHCNLRCNHCGLLCNYINKEIFVDINNYKEDLKELTKKIAIKEFRIFGGEPLLHPQINDFLKITRKYLPDTKINLATNGLLLLSMSEDFFNILRRTEIQVDISVYPILENKQLENIIHKLEKYKVKYYIGKRTLFIEQLNKKGNSKKKLAFMVCPRNKYINLWDHCLYICPSMFRKFYNEITNENLVLQKAYNIYKYSGKKLYQELIYQKKPTNACTYCKEKILIHKWQKYETKNK